MAKALKWQRNKYKLLNTRSDTAENILIKRMATNYRSSLKSIEEQIKELYEKFAERDLETGALILPGSKQNVARRLRQLKKNIDKELGLIYAANEDLLSKYAIGIYEDNYYTLGFIGEQSWDINLTFDFVNRRNIIAALRTNPATGIKLADIISKNRGATRRLINGAINRSITENKTIGQLTKELKNIIFEQRGNQVQGDAARAFRIARTEVGRIKNAGRIDSINNIEDQVKDIDGIGFRKEWLSTLDDRTRGDHVKADGQNIATDGTVKTAGGTTIAKDGLFHVGGHTAVAPQQFGVAAQDINCRCTVIVTFFGEAPKVRRVDHKIVTAETANEWKKKKIKELSEKDNPKTTEKTLDDLLKQ